MNKYLSFFRIRLVNGLQYRAAAWAGVATQFAWGGMTILLFRAFYRHNAAGFPMPFNALSSYIWLQQAFLALYASWYFDNEILTSITSGNIAYELCRPIDLYNMWFIKNMAVRLSRAILRCFPILIVAAFLPEPYGISLPASPFTGLLSLFSIQLGFMIMVAFSMLIYIATFYMLSPLGIRILATSTVDFLAGGIIPLPFFPEPLQKWMLFLPFSSMQNTPFQIYTGFFTKSEAILGFLLQICWLAALLILGKWLMHQALKKVVVQGG